MRIQPYLSATSLNRLKKSPWDKPSICFRHQKIKLCIQSSRPKTRLLNPIRRCWKRSPRMLTLISRRMTMIKLAIPIVQVLTKYSHEIQIYKRNYELAYRHPNKLRISSINLAKILLSFLKRSLVTIDLIWRVRTIIICLRYSKVTTQPAS